MGGRLSSICDPSSSCRREVLVMKEDGELLRFKEDTRVKDILAANPYHNVIRGCSSSDRIILPVSFQLTCNQLYFLLPRGLSLSDETYESLLKLAASRNTKFTAPNRTKDGGIRKSQPSDESNTTKFLYSKDDAGNHSTRWKPALQTIPEVNSPLPAPLRVM